jgi:uncharacterized cupredoxin-like copper-binding protein
MNIRKSLFTMAFCALALSVPATAETLVRVTLIDKSGAADSAAPRLGMGMHADMSKAKMAISANPKQAKRGAVRFEVTNLASGIIHEVIVARITDENQILPYDESRNKVDAEQLLTMGSVNEINPNASAALTVNLTPGKYLLYCNIAGHYMAGMWTTITVQ